MCEAGVQVYMAGDVPPCSDYSKLSYLMSVSGNFSSLSSLNW